MGKSTTASVKDRNGELTLQHHDSDSPILPVAQLEQLSRIKPEAVDWVINQTQIEAEFRREETKRINTFTLVERIIGQVCALIIGLAGINRRKSFRVELSQNCWHIAYPVSEKSF